MKDQIEIMNVVPAFFASVEHRSSDVWGQQVSLNRGQAYAVSGASGKGKSTLLNMLFGVRKIPNGEMFYKERALSKITSKERSEWRCTSMSMVFQDLRLFEHLTAHENIQLKWALHKDRTWEEINVWCEQLQVAELLHTPCMKLSLGQQQRIAVVRALVSPFEWLFMDEPTSHLDQVNAQKVMTLVHAECKRRGAGLIVTTLESQPTLGQDQILFC